MNKLIALHYKITDILTDALDTLTDLLFGKPVPPCPHTTKVDGICAVCRKKVET